ncbi:MAG: hypothetical protein VB934_00475, partial [Polyangiaceae bacterium]
VTLPDLRSGDRELGPLVTTSVGGGTRLLLGRRARPRALQIELSGSGEFTHYFDTLYVEGRNGIFAALSLHGEMD